MAREIQNFSDVNMNGNQVENGVVDNGKYRIGNGIDYKYTIKHDKSTMVVSVTAVIVATNTPVMVTWKPIDGDNIEVSFGKVIPTGYIDIYIK